MTNHYTTKKDTKQIKDEFYGSDEEDENEMILEKEYVSSDHSSFITNKYVEDTNKPTVANKFSDMIISLEKIFSLDKEELLNPEPEDSFLLRYNNAFKAYKTIRGTTLYYGNIKTKRSTQFIYHIFLR